MSIRTHNLKEERLEKYIEIILISDTVNLMTRKITRDKKRYFITKEPNHRRI